MYISGIITDSKRSGDYEVYCPEHDLLHTTSIANYARSRTGLPCCGKKQASKKLLGRVFSEETLLKMANAANTRPDRGGKPRRWRENHAYRKWVLDVRNFWKNECAITGEKNISPGDGTLVVHHLFSAHAEENQDLVLIVENGILIHKDLHTQFHLSYGYKNNTVAQFKEFILKLLNKEIIVSISSRGELKGSQGSETRVYDPPMEHLARVLDPDRIMKLYKRLSEIEAILVQAKS